MKADPLIRQRFEELSKKAEGVAAKKEFEFRSSDTGKAYHIIPSALFKEWATSVLNLLHRAFGVESVHYQEFDKHYQQFSKWESEFDDCVAIFRAAREDYEGGYLFNIRSLVKAEVLDDTVEQAQELLRAGYKDPACVVIGIALEITLKELCTHAGISHAKLDKMNVDLAKQGKYNLAKQKQITAWADLRNKAAHGDWTAYNAADVKDFADGVARFIADFL